MQDYVYALHDFRPENEDELEFAAGERVEILEKDDLFGDGWWKGRNLAGREGLFPGSYTTAIPPGAPSSDPNDDDDPNDDHNTATSMSVVEVSIPRSTLQPLREESETGSPPILSPVPRPPPENTILNGGSKGYESDAEAEIEPASSYSLRSPASDGEMMRATMTDVQKAIEQLGRGGANTEDHDGARSFSFASTREGDTETDDTDFDLSDLDGGGDAEGAEDWHKNARRKLAAKARRAVQEAERLESMMTGGPGTSTEAAPSRRAVAPPIEVEISDESDMEDDHDFTRSSKFRRNQPPGILEEDEEEDEERLRVPLPMAKDISKDSSATETHQLLPNELYVSSKEESEPPTAKAATESFPTFSLPIAAAISSAFAETTPQVRPPSPPQQQAVANEGRSSLSWKSYSPSFSPPPPQQMTPNAAASNTSSQQSQDDQRRSSVPISINGQASPAASTHLSQFLQEKHASVLSSSSAPAMIMPQPSHQSTFSEPATSPSSDLKKTHPSEWNLEQVLEWLKSKGFDQDVCDKFAEQEITGDVLLELDANVLKSEIGIMAYGKRIRIANSIADLRRPPSFEFPVPNLSSEHPSPIHSQNYTSSGSGQANGISNGFPSNLHSRTQSQSQQSQHSYPGTALTTTNTLAYPPSVRSSLGSPVGHGPLQQQQQQYPTAQNGNGASPYVYDMSANGHPQADAISTNGGYTSSTAGAHGLGIGMTQTGRPAQLSLSPSEGALKDLAAKGVIAVPGPIGEDDRGHMSEGEAPSNPTSMRRRLFGRSQDSAVTGPKTGGSKESPTSSPIVRDSDKDSAKTGTEEHVKGKDRDSARDSSSLRSRHRPKKSIDGAKSSDRLSIFGSSFGGSLGKHRKPPPAAGEEPPTLSEKSSSSKFHLPKLHSSSVRKASAPSERPSVGPPDIEKSASHNAGSLFKEKNSEKHTLRKRTSSAPAISPTALSSNGVSSTDVGEGVIHQGQSILDQIGEPDYAGWMRKRGERYNAWKSRYLVLKGPHLYYLRSNNKAETRLKGYIHVVGYKVTVDENIDPGKYGFRIDHDNDKTHYFSSDEKSTVREWMKAIMKATIGRDYTKPVVSSCNIPTIPLVVAQAMNPAPRPPSPGAREATQKAMLRRDTSQLSSRDARVLMGIPGESKDQLPRVESFFNNDGTPGLSPPPPLSPSTPVATQQPVVPPPRPSREVRRSASIRTGVSSQPVDDSLISWANSHLPEHLQIVDPTGPLYGGLAILRLAESIRGRPSSPPVPDSAFPSDPHDDKLDGLFRLFDFLLDNDVKMGSVSINDVRQGKRDKIIQLLRALKSWEEKRKALANSIVKGAAPSSYMPMVR
ncbi:hypothetical protein CPB83DRAFT_802726 [Crepidotus variabilis]|uniref:Uncharacterized protein n=1 Tax=Crepidotus variabilis TaxID=179855 RepID=A0A9P6EU07_9AGAR|nr:hypothetical protein CPB83DRAFT_802726 [Crepidotus variabilis]